MATYENTPRIWLGCLNCYNGGRLVGAWYEAADLYNDEELGTTADVHKKGGYRPGEYCEEIWGLDQENMPPRGEIGLAEARKWGERYEELDSDEEWLAYCAWVRDSNDDGSVQDFKDHYRGSWESFAAYVQDTEESEGLFDGWSELAVRHFDWDSYIEEVEQGYSVIDAPSGVWIFSY